MASHPQTHRPGDFADAAQQRPLGRGARRKIRTCGFSSHHTSSARGLQYALASDRADRRDLIVFTIGSHSEDRSTSIARGSCC